MKYNLLTALFLMLYGATCDGQLGSTPTDPFELCSLFKDGTRIRKPGSCTEYITCSNGSGKAAACEAPKQFDRNKQNCVSAETLSTRDDYCRNRCEGVNGKWVADPTTCRGFLYCDAGKPLQGYCQDGYFFNEKTQICEFDDVSDCNVVPNICEIVADKTQYRNEKDCTIYYECSNGKSSQKTCKSTYYNVETGKCEEKSMVRCSGHPLPSKVCGTDNKPYHGFKSDDATCRGFFYCRDLGSVHDLEPSWSQCRENEFFSYKAQGCVEPIEAICLFNRCQGRPDMMVQSSTNNCRDYIICKDGVQVEKRSCHGDLFFDEKSQACVLRKIYYTSCNNQK